MPFTKLDEGILHSSIMVEPPETFKVWIALLASTGPDGIARVSSTFLAAACYFPIEVVDAALATLEAPDPRSRSLADEGRRIKRVDGGYFVINYEKYRAFSYSEKPESVRKREYRAKTEAEEKAFAAWWDRYPRKIGKQDAFAAYVAALKGGASEDALLKSIEHYMAELVRLGTEEKYIKHPATFLRKERWRDYVDAPAPVVLPSAPARPSWYKAKGGEQ